MKGRMPDGPTALRDFAELMEGQAARHDRLQCRRSGEISTTAENFRTAASIARQEASRLEKEAIQRAGGSQ